MKPGKAHALLLVGFLAPALLFSAALAQQQQAVRFDATVTDIAPDEATRLAVAFRNAIREPGQAGQPPELVFRHLPAADAPSHGPDVESPRPARTARASHRPDSSPQERATRKPPMADLTSSMLDDAAHLLHGERSASHSRDSRTELGLQGEGARGAMEVGQRLHVSPQRGLGSEPRGSGMDNQRRNGANRSFSRSGRGPLGTGGAGTTGGGMRGGMQHQGGGRR